MIFSLRFCAFRFVLPVVLAISICSLSLPAQNPPAKTPPESAAPAAPPTSASSDTAAKAAERKRRFEQEKSRLENAAAKPQGSAETQNAENGSCQASENDLSLSPILVNMLVGETQRFSLFDLAGHKLTAQADWSVSDSSIAELTFEPGNVPVLTSKQTGSVHLGARVDSRSTEATVNVITQEDMKPGTVRWSAPATPCFKTKQIAVAVPH